MKRLEKQLFLFLLLLGGVIYGQFGGDPGIDPGGSGFGGGIELIPITGATNVDLNSTHIYTVTALGGDQPSTGSWEVPGATIISSSATRATIKWTSVGSKEMTYRGSLGTRNFLSPYFVTVNALPVAPPTPSVPTISQNNCGSMVLSRATPPSGITWYWQGTNGNGTGAGYSNSTYNVSNSGRYYLRARDNSSGLWSAASSSIQVSVKTIPSVPPTASVVNNCGSSVLTKGSQPSGITFYWQSSASGTSTSNSSTSINRTSGSVYYLRARNNSSGCWSSARSVSYSIKTVPSVPPTASVVNNCGSSILTKGSQPSGITFYWQSSASGTSTSNSLTSLTRTSGSVYYLRARNNSTGCWSSSRTVSYSIKTIPSTPTTPSVVNNCGSSVLTKGSQPSGITWYWQSNERGTSTSNSSTSITRTSGSVYYLRARNNSTGCWGGSRTVSYSIKTIPSIPPTASVVNNCGSSVLTKVSQPSGITFYWQSSAGGESTSNSATSITRTSGSVYYLRARNNSTGCWGSSRTVSYSIKTIPSVPAAASVVNNCGSSVLTKVSQPSGITFYWQSSAGGESTSNSATSITRTSGSVYYLRARNNSTGCWGSSRTVSYSVKTIPSVPAAASVVNNCGSSVLTKGSQPSGITFYWQSSASGTSTSNSATSITRTSGSVYYLRARNNSTGCWGSSRTVSYSIKTIPSVPAAASVVNNCGSSVLTKGNQPSGITFYWQSSASGTSTGNSATSLTRTSGSVYYLRARNNSTGCWSSSRTVSYSVKTIPSVPTAASVVNNCGSSVLTKGSQPSGITFYWQSSAGGTSTSNSATSLSRTSGSVYYLRARNNSSGCWGSARTVNYTIQQPSTWYADTDGDGYGNSTSTTSACSKPSGYVANSSDYNDSTTNITNIAPQTFYLDADNDGFGDPNTSVYYSVKPSGYVTNNTDACPNTAGANNGCNYTASVFSNENYVFTRGYRKAMTSPSGITDASDVVESIVYFDGLGRAKQSIGIRQGTSGKDIVTHMEYDAFGRQTKEYLPYATTSQNGLISTGDIATATKTYYQTAYSEDFAGVPLPAINAYSEKVLESSPLNRVFEQAAPGKDWAIGSSFSSKGYTNNSHSIKFEYNANEANEVKIFGVTTTYANKTYTPSLTGGVTFYPAAVLYKTITKDENWTTGLDHTTEEFKNKQGQVILKRTYDNSQKHDTYYVYDDFGNLSYVLPPKIDASEVANTLAVIQTKLNDLGYQYKYDDRNRLIEKRIPGKGRWENIVYDRLDRPVMTYDDSKGEEYWYFTKYDQLGRVACTGLWENEDGLSRNEIQRDLIDNYPLYETIVLGSYSDVAFPNNSVPSSSILKLYTINYYDTYVDVPVGLNPTVTTSYGATSTATTKGLATVSKVRVLGTNNWITTVSYYDEKARPIYVYSKNDELQTIDILESKLDDFTGRVLETKTTHTKDGKAAIVTVDKFTYDNLDRITKQTQTIGGTTEVIAENSYDELGQLTEKQVGGKTNQSRLQTVDYKYNVRGWLKNINQDANNDNDLFNFTLKYNDVTDANKRLYNGNISETNWNTLSVNNTPNSVSNKYVYTYDALNRITRADDNTGRYDIYGISYDKNGNIINLRRDGHTDLGGTSFGVMDNLVYYYNGNQLHSVTDSGNVTYGFKDGNISDSNYSNGDGDDDFKYDDNGNMIKDANKGITNIVYNHLNLPTQVTIGGQNINYTYDAAGMKLKKVVNGITTEYAGNYIYENNTLQFFNHPEGYIKPVFANGSTAISSFDYVYQYKDHLGNVRLSYTDNDNNGVIQTDGANSEIVEESNYYPFGLKHKGYNGVKNIGIGNARAQKFGFGGKELNEELGLQWHDFDARNYEASLGRWMNIDPLTEDYYEWSPYNFVYNSPLKFVDPTGMGPETTIVEKLKDGKYKVVDWVDDGKTDVTLKDGTKVGESLTTHSFVDEKNKAVKGAIIDTKSNEGQEFIDKEIIKDNPNVVSYMVKAYKVGQSLDFKSRDLDKSGKELKVHAARGSMTKDGKMASARDFGNMAAGIVSGRAGISSSLAKIAFNALQGGQEPPVSAKAQAVGLEIGNKMHNKALQKIIPTLNPKWNMNHVKRK
ncbi:DUF6443 domain-containing protein [uncultured Tenacibaculum sp.]|uniref:DUF6443 domain-containing protein n=1 Tax=uncultured Tenacibaculum sp. TaxID=174713 RepID=UPI0026395F0A|nr:DUF6443 domain-containing protein [uncultured Tenacibaculum sp.]